MADELHLIRDILDKQLVDREGLRMGKVDGIVLAPRKDKPPRVTAIESGAAVLASRFHPRLARWVERWLRRMDPRAALPVRIPFEKILHRGRDLQVDVDARRTSAFAVERWVAEHFIDRIPGAGRK